ncbi:hypothetical protein BGZ80_002988 [Entomortierella chlamydospora]|uniref:Uncharacterized protein n=1 Tax=Entomortierella chlamydospora TaxID=101097 RepID=A0A9P6SX83_9FUNG|nr:hypothetical protein BGZ80_002988 [Entomortierella chlamydospora]
MAAFENGIYNITRGSNQSLTTLGSQANCYAIFGDPGFDGGVEKWELTTNDDGTVSLRDVKCRLFLSLDDAENIQFHQSVQLGEKEYHWRLSETSNDGKVYIQAVGRSEDGDDYVIDLGMARIYPPRLALMRKDQGNEYQGWSFVRAE